jgi:hypothetical protein
MRDPLLALPALLALVMLTGTAPARAQMLTMALCNGGTASVPGNAPAGRDCDTACHAGCQRRKAAAQARGG